MTIPRRIVLLFALLALSGCARGVAVGSAEPGRNFSVQVFNETTVALLVSYNDGRADALLGTVQPGRSERFIIASPARTDVTIRGISASGGRTSGPYSVALITSSTVSVRLR